MEIITTTVTRTAEETTPNGTYAIDYTVTDGKLERASATVRSPDEQENGKYLGNIGYENGSINCSFLYYPDRKAALLLEDFQGILSLIRESTGGGAQ